jgi:hypothetical protein
MTQLPWKAWHQVVHLREDLRAGELPLHLFAADLYEVLMRRGERPVYEEPQQFFALTYPTYNLRQLVREVMLRLAGRNDKAVRQLELTYGGGKTHTLITLLHLVRDPENLPELPAVAEFTQEIGMKPPCCRIAGLCFDKLDVEKGMEVKAPDGKVRTLKEPWSVLAFQLAGDAGLSLLHAEDRAEERNSAPAENLLVELLKKPGEDGLGTLVLIDEVLMYAREKVGHDQRRLNSLVNFFQYLTQAATKVNRCCIVASLLTSEPTTEDELGRKIKAQLYDIFQRQREEAVEPVIKEDVAEVLRRRFFTPDSLKRPDTFRQHVVAALKGINAVDEQTARHGAEAEERFLKSYPFHPDLTDVLYAKWTTLSRFQRTRGVLRTFALALREAEKWDLSPLIGPAVFLNSPGTGGLSDSLRELVAVADTEEWEGRRQAWTGILDKELSLARQIQADSVGLKYHEIEQAVIATFLHSQPIGQNAKTRDLTVLLGASRADKIELEKGLSRWVQISHWLDDHYAVPEGGQLPGAWRLGNRPNLNQMHANALRSVSDELVNAKLLDEVGKTKSLTAGASAAGVKVHTLPPRPRDIEDDGAFHYAVLGPGAASDSGKPSSEARRFLDETTGPDKPRVYRNAVLLLVPSKDGLELAKQQVRDYLAWELVNEELKKQQVDGNVDAARAQTLRINIDKAKGRITGAVKQAYCIVVTISDKDEVVAYKIVVNDDYHFNIIKNDRRSRVQDTAVTAAALLPDGPYNLWHERENTRRVKDLAGAFAQFTHLPKMLKSSAILDTLAEGCEKGTFVLRLARPDGSLRTWWMSRPDESVLNEPALELVLSEGAELSEIAPEMLSPGRLPGLWQNDEVTFKTILHYFNGSTIVQVDCGTHQEPMPIPKTEQGVLEKAVCSAVEKGSLWLLSGPASILGEPVPAGVLNETSVLSAPPPAIPATAILSENLPGAWKYGLTNGLSIATALSVKANRILPWKTVRDAINGALQARFLELAEGSPEWPCDFSSAQFVKFKEFIVGHDGGTGNDTVRENGTNILSAQTELEPSQVQDLADLMPKLLNIKARTNIPLRFIVKIEIGDGEEKPSEEAVQQLNELLKGIKDDFEFRLL